MKIIRLALICATSVLLLACKHEESVTLDTDVVADSIIDGYGYVDLGLPSKRLWAVNNVGAEKPEGLGDYYQWGAVKPMSVYSWKTYSVESFEDVATKQWGEKWRMPKEEECYELIYQCTWIWAQLHGVQGYKVVGKNNKWIFLPAAGYKKNQEYSNTGVYGEYWSSDASKAQDDNLRAQGIHFEKSVVSELLDNRCWGFVVRPVLAIEIE
ncbi:MAG: hypothetical protein MJZ75_00660 [Paludibacteraceae bacterium]|nr:hypothetical protein [Paludibacteraceae bacterium]